MPSFAQPPLVPAWSVLEGTPRCESFASGAWDAKRGRFLSYGPSGLSALTLRGPAVWTLLAPLPESFDLSTIVYLPSPSAVVAFHGMTGNAWYLPLDGPLTWQLLPNTGLRPPGSRGALAVYDSRRNRMLVHGGLGDFTGEVWVRTFDGSTVWTRIQAPGGPPRPRWLHAAAYDSLNDRMIVFGGDKSGDGCPDYDDTWALNLSGTPTWVPIATDAVRPPILKAMSLVEDPQRQQMLLYGGYNCSGWSSAVWVLPLVGYQNWTPIYPSGTSPWGTQGQAAAMARDSSRLVISAGDGRGPTCALTWQLRFAPPPRQDSAVVRLIADPEACISTATPCVTLSCELRRSPGPEVRGYSVKFRLSEGLEVCPEGPAGGPFLAGPGGAFSTFFTSYDDSAGNITVAEAILGSDCGAEGFGQLFTLPVRSSLPSGIGTIEIVELLLRDCENRAIAVEAGAPAAVRIGNQAPQAITGLSVTAPEGATPGRQTFDLRVDFELPESMTAEIYRASYGPYPTYSPGGAPARPASYPPGPEWKKTSITAPGGMDSSPTRGHWYYVAYAKDGCGNPSAASEVTAGVLNYHLGDVHDGAVSCRGNNLVNTADVSYLGNRYGLSVASNHPAVCLDFGPTADGSVLGRPVPDGIIEFEDLILLAINYGAVSGPQARAERVRAATGPTDIALRLPPMPAPGETFDAQLWLSGGGGVHGLSIPLSYDPAQLEPLAVEPGELLARQGAEHALLSPRPGVVDVALLGASTGFEGEGELARVRFRVKAAGAAAPTLGAVRARDASNRPVTLGERPTSPPQPAAPHETRLGPIYPNPIRGQATVEYALAQPGHVKLAIYDLAGRRVRTLVERELAAGRYAERWDATDDQGAPARPGIYLLRARLAERETTQRLLLIR